MALRILFKNITLRSGMPLQLNNLVCKRDSSYRSSPIAQDPSCYAKYEVSSSPEEWKFVERLLPSTLIPTPSDRKDLPSGWQPQTATFGEYPYFVHRSRNHMLPVYLKVSMRGTRRITQINNVDGNIWALEAAIKKSAGNVVVLKTAEQTPLSGLVAASLIKEAGFPPGVVNVISGFGKVAGAAISSHMNIDKVAFTGSTLVGRQIMKAAAGSNLKKVTLELGGKSPNIVFEDADIDNAISWVNFGIYFNHGQCCCAGSRIYVQESIYDTFIERFKARAAANAVGDPFHNETFQGPQVSQLQFDRIMSYIEEGKKAGATVETGGKRKGDKGYFIEPTIFSNVTEDMKIVQEEIFGPVCTISKFKTKEEVVKIGNNTTYGLAAAVHTKNLNTAIEVSNQLKAGTVWVNTYNTLHWQLPFGGYKESGIGRELGEAALDNYLQTKTVSIRLGDALFG